MERRPYADFIDSLPEGTKPLGLGVTPRMTMTHKEALDRARRDLWTEASDMCTDDDLTNAIRAYIEARGLVLVPKKMTWAQKHVFIGHCSSAEEAQAIYSEVLAAAPDPFEEGE